MQNKIIHFKTIDSTNTYGLSNFENLQDKTVIIADEQTKGRGRLGRSFYSPSGSGIYMTLILRPSRDAQKALLLTCAAAVAVSRGIESVFPLTTQIKWVNDVYVDSKKVCGILTEGGINPQTNTLDYMVLGIGINVSTDFFPEDISHIATSLSDTPVNRNLIIGKILNALEEMYLALPDSSFMSEYRQKSLVLGKDVWVIQGDERYRAYVCDVDCDGHLVVTTDTGDKKIISTGEVSIRFV